MTQDEYLAAVDAALKEFKEEIVPQMWGNRENQLEHLNDELMLAVYEYTKDPRRA